MAAIRRLKARLRLLRPRRRRINPALLRLSLRVLPRERRRVFALTLLNGVLCGLTAVGFLDQMLLGHSGNEVGAFALVGMGTVFGRERPE